VAIARSQSSRDRGKPAQWIVSTWTRGGNVPDVIIRLRATPASVSPVFSFGCGSHDGTPACDLGAVDASSAVRQLKAQVTVPVGATAVRSVRLVVMGSAAHLPTDPYAAAAVTITAAPPPTPPPGSPTPTVSPVLTFSPLPVGTLPGVQAAANGAGPTLSPGGNAGNLFPTLALAKGAKGKKASTRVVANVSALPGGASVIAAQLVGLLALGLGFLLAVTRMTVRRRPSQRAAKAPDTDNPDTDNTAASDTSAKADPPEE
jgi:hypothetical protein